MRRMDIVVRPIVYSLLLPPRKVFLVCVSCVSLSTLRSHVLRSVTTVAVLQLLKILTLRQEGTS